MLKNWKARESCSQKMRRKTLMLVFFNIGVGISASRSLWVWFGISEAVLVTSADGKAG
jgi:hypothetical protein